MEGDKFKSGDLVVNRKNNKRYIINYRTALDSRFCVPRYDATLLGARPRRVVILETGLQKEGKG